MAVNKRIYKADPALELAGVTTLSLVENIVSDAIQPLREKHNLVEIDTEKWYPVQQVFDLFNDIVEEHGTQSFVAMGMKIAEQSEFPPEMLGSELSLVQILEGWQTHYEANHRGGDYPPVGTIKVADNHYQLVLKLEHIYPYDLVYGMVYGFCKLLLPKGTPFTVKYDEKQNPHTEGASKILINVMWG